MLGNLVYLVFLCCCAASCGSKQTPSDPPPAPLTIAILPFNDADIRVVNALRDSLENQLSAKVTILEKTALPESAFYKPRYRYIADSLLIFLANVNAGRFDKIMGITSKDISTRKGDIENWGILGLGFCPGVSCVISGFRAGNLKVNMIRYNRRINTLALHELGHTFGLPHCESKLCLMNDANGKMKLDDTDLYCRKCKILLQEKGVLK